ncbi:hypothetical protein ABB37_08086 [Leptomonas pyrrhocoris]|uniref:Uncharacterized protein n=1 Tax=Leptomonas pyrrhocoris TaxID=157538 RepID=A0A0M9FTZ3_LEPPY|nr:hypothetical protein ABB37_08086 [Leptomonas pyrrhocoris]KPA75917.1 hypothetical protein ABB37_08086 [Leptomonas pyrrhocoris]|eukprot:XP_015654356.1 hypothetical protein ABB37_08086 [Leptomonas pyrrhocoris]
MQSTPAPSTAANKYTSADVPRSEDDVTQYVLYDGLPKSGPAVRHARERQAQAYERFTHRIRERVEAAHAIVLSANPLSLSVMASQLRMYRWKVTEAQTLLEATALLQDFVLDTSKHGYRVRRRPAAPLGQSRYAYGRGKHALMRVVQEEREKLAKESGGLFGASATSPTGSSSRIRADLKDTAAAAADIIAASARHPTTAAALPEAHDDDDGVSAPDEAGELYEEHEEDRLPLPSPDALPRLVLVDSFTHEDFADIARHIRFVDNEHGLELLLILLLPTDPETAAVDTQGAGCVITPAFTTTMDEAYKAGYDLVLAHNMDNLLVGMLTSAFVSSVGRWRNDVRSKAAVGNYMSVRNVLLGGLDTASLQQLVWDDKVDDAEVLELLGAQSLAMQGDAKRYGEASRQLLGQQQQQQQQQQLHHTGGSSSGEDEDDEDGTDKKLKRVASSMMSHVPRLRSRPTSVAHFGVRLPADPERARGLLANFGSTKDVLGGLMEARGGRRRRQFDGDGVGENADEADYSMDGLGEDHRMLRIALEKEMGRLLAENEGKQTTIDELQKDVETLHRTVDILKQHLPRSSGGGGAGGSGVGGDLGSFSSRTYPERPDSASMMHLSKEQQIYILKERLEAANDRISVLLKDSHGAEHSSDSTATMPGRGRGGTDRRGRVGIGVRGGSSSPASRRATAGGAAHSRSLNLYRRRAGEAYQAAREAEVMALHDDDAYYANITLGELPRTSQGDTYGAGGNGGTCRTETPLVQRKEREATDKVINSLQTELRLLQGRLDDLPDDDDGYDSSRNGDVQTRMVAHLQSAVERLEVERQRVRHLEELRQTDQLLLTHAVRLNEHAKRQLSAARRAAAETRRQGSAVSAGGESAGAGAGAGADTEGIDSSSTSVGRRSRRTGDGAARTRSRKTEAAGGDESDEKERAGPQKGGAAPPKAKGKRRGPAEASLLQPEQVEGLIAAAVTDAVTARNRVFRRQLGALVQTCRAQLTRIVLKQQKPRTDAYLQLLREELEQAKRDQRGAVMRLQFTLSHLRPDQYDTASIPRSEKRGRMSYGGGAGVRGEADGADAEGTDGDQMIPLCAVTDDEVRHAAERIAREHAAYALRAAYMTSELQRVQRAPEVVPPTGAAAPGSRPTSASLASREQLHRALQKATQQVKEVVDGGSPVPTYLDAVRAEMEAEQRLSTWYDVDCAQLFRAPPPVVPSSTSCTVPPAPNLALVPTKVPSAEEGAVPLRLADVDGGVRDVANLYATVLRSFMALGEGWVFGLKSSSSSSSSSNDVSGGIVRSTTRAAAAAAAVVRPARPAKEGKSRKTGSAGKKRREKSIESGAEEDFDLEGTDEDSNRPLTAAIKEPLSFQQALAQLPVATGEAAQYEGQLSELYTAEVPYSAAQQRLYEILLRAYQQHCINPLHMATLETAVLTASDAPLSATEPAAAAEHQNQLLPLRLATAHAQHREVLALLQLVAPTATPALRRLTQQVRQAQRLVEQETASAPPHTSAAFLSAVDAALLGCVVDELRWQQQWRRATTSTAAAAAEVNGAAAAPPAENPQEVLRKALVTARTAGTPAHLLPLPSSDLDEAAPSDDVRLVEYYTAFCAARARAAHAAGGAAGLSGNANGGGGNDDLFDLSGLPAVPLSSAEAYQRLATLLPDRNASAAADGAGGAGGTVARELAAYFSARRPAAGKAGDGTAASAEDDAAAFLTEIYLDDVRGGLDGDEGGDGGAVEEEDANLQAIRRLRMELEYMEVIKKQRMEELALRCDWRLRGRLHGDGGADALPFPGGVPDGADGGAAYPAVNPERLNFMVKSGTAAWYGMEAAKRVRAILRRRARPDQIIVGGGPYGGGVGVELSRRTAQPPVMPTLLGSDSPRTAAAVAAVAAKTRKKNHNSSGGGGGDGGNANSNDSGEDENGYTVEDEGDSRAQRYERRGSPSPLPPLSSSLQHQQQQSKAFTSPGVVPLPLLPQNGMPRSQRQQQQQQRPGPRANFATSTPPPPQRQQQSDFDGPPPQPFTYMSPRDAVNLGAFTNLTSGYNGGSSAYLRGSADDLISRVTAYREELTRAAGRVSPMTTTTYANGAPFCLPFASLPGTGGAAAAGGGAGVRPRPPLPQQTSWVYGLPATAVTSMVHQQSTVDPQQPRDTVLFMPRRTRSSIAEVAERDRAAAATQRHFSMGAVGLSAAGAVAPDVSYTTPAAMAAQRLQAMLSASMEDPSVGGGAAVPLAAAMRTHQLAEQQRRRQLSHREQEEAEPRLQGEQHDRASSSATPPSPAEAAPPPPS